MPITLHNGNGGTGEAHAFGGTIKELVATFKYAAVYATGGEAIDFKSYLAGLPDFASFASTNGYNFEYLKATGKVKAYTTAGVEVVAAVDLTALVIPFCAKRYLS